MMSTVEAADVAFQLYAEEFRRSARLEQDPRATELQRAQQRLRTKKAYSAFWRAFMGENPKPALRLINTEGSSPDA